MYNAIIRSYNKKEEQELKELKELEELEELEKMKKGFQNFFAGAGKKNGLSLPAGAVALAAGLLIGCGAGGADGDLGTVMFKTGARAEQAGGQAEKPETGAETQIRTFSAQEAAVVPEVKAYAFSDAMAAGEVVKIRGMLPGAAEGVWYTVTIEGVSYFYGAYDGAAGSDAEYFGYALVSDRYALQNGLAVGMTMDEALAKYPDLAVLDFAGTELGKHVTGHQGWNGTAFPRSDAGMDGEWDYAGSDYAWTDKFDCVMLADVDTGEADALPVYAAFFVRDDRIAAIAFCNPTAG